MQNKIYRQNPKAKQRIKAASRRQWAKRLAKLGLAPQDYEKVLKAQSGGCALCNSKRPQGRWGKFNFDHDHETGRPRGLLCHRCNKQLAWLGDTASRGAVILDYLLRGVLNNNLIEHAVSSHRFLKTSPGLQDWLVRWQAALA